MHFTVLRDAGGCCFYNRTFRSVSDLVSHYRTNDVPNAEGIRGLRLTVPIRDLTRSIVTRFSSNHAPAGSLPGSGARYSAPPAMPFRDTPTCTAPPPPPSVLARRSADPCAPSTREGLPRGTAPRPPASRASDPLAGFPPRSLVDIHEAPPGVVSENCLNGASQRNCSLGENIIGGVAAPNCMTEGAPPRLDGGGGGGGLYYSSVRDTYLSSAQQLIDALKQERCEYCGLSRVDAELPQGWEVHLLVPSEGTGGGGEGKVWSPRVFYEGPGEKETAWRLPESVERALSPAQREFLRGLEEGGGGGDVEGGED